MKRTNVIKTLVLGALGFATLGFVGCGGDSSSSSQQNAYTGFLPGAQTTIIVGDSLLIKDIIDAAEKGTYTVTITYNGEVEDVTRDVAWQPTQVGTYVLTYTINEGENKGTYTHTIEVISPKYINVSRLLEPITVVYEQEVVFEDFFQDLNIAVSSHSNYDIVMLNVRVDGEITTFSENQTSYKIESYSEHVFSYAIRTTDGREREFVSSALVTYSLDQRDIWVNAQAAGEYIIEQSNVVSVKINDEVCTETDVQITATGVVVAESVLHDKYSGVNRVSLTTQSGEEIRLVLNVYTEMLSFENGLLDGVFFFKDFTSNAGMKLTEENNSKTLTMWGAHRYQRFYISRKYVDFVFTNPDIDLFMFDITANFEATTGVSYVQLYNAVTKTYAVCNKGKPITIEISREAWEAYDNQLGVSFEFMNQANNTGTVQITWNIDNMQGVYWNVTLNQTQTAFQGIGDTVQLLATSELTDCNAVWTSANEEIATVDQTGKVTAVGYGETTITANVLGVKATCIVGLYKDMYDFEDDATVDSVIYMGAWSTNGSMTLAQYNQSNALKLYGENQYQSFYISTGYLAWAFSNPYIKAVNIDIAVSFTSTTGAEYILLGVGNKGKVVYYTLYNGKTTTISYTRDSYEAWIAGGGTELQCQYMNQAHNTGTVPLTWYIDNIQTVISPVIEDFNDKLHSNFIQPYYTSTSTSANQTASLVNGYSGETSPKWQKTAWVNGNGKSGESDDLAYLMQFENASALSKFGISVAFLDEVFADASVTAMTWDMKCNAATVSHITTDVAQSWTSDYQAVECVEYTMTRADYEAIKVSGKQFLTITLGRDSGVANYGTSPIVLFDNFTCVFAE